MKSCQQKSDESPWEYIWRFSRKCHELPKVSDTNVISAFWSSMTCQTLVHKLGCDLPMTTKKLLDIATQHGSGEEVVGPSLFNAMGKLSPAVAEGHHPKPLARELRKAPKEAKEAKAVLPIDHNYYQPQQR
jgi:hypothetical protein